METPTNSTEDDFANITGVLGNISLAPINSTQVDGGSVGLPHTNISNIPSEGEDPGESQEQQISRRLSNSEQTITIENEGGEIEGAENEGGDRNSKDKSTEKPPTFNQSSLNDNVYRCNRDKLCKSKRGLSQHIIECKQGDTADSNWMVIHSSVQHHDT